MSDESPEVGEILRRNGDNWLVEEVEDAKDGTTVVTLRPQPRIRPETEDDE